MTPAYVHSDGHANPRNANDFTSCEACKDFTFCKKRSRFILKGTEWKADSLSARCRTFIQMGTISFWRLKAGAISCRGALFCPRCDTLNDWPRPSTQIAAARSLSRVWVATDIRPLTASKALCAQGRQCPLRQYRTALHAANPFAGKYGLPAALVAGASLPISTTRRVG